MVKYIYLSLYRRAEVKSRMKRTKNLAYGMIFGLAIFGIVMMGITAIFQTTSAMEEKREYDINAPDGPGDGGNDYPYWDASGRCWYNDEDGAYAVSAGYGGVTVGFETEWEDGHGASIGIAVRGNKEQGTGHFEEIAIETDARTEDYESWPSTDYYWDVKELKFDTDEHLHFKEIEIGSETYTEWRFELGYHVEVEKDRPWPWSDSTESWKTGMFGGSDYNPAVTYLVKGSIN